MLKFRLHPLAVLAIFGLFATSYSIPWIKAELHIVKGREAFFRGDFQSAVAHLSPAIDTLGEHASRLRPYWVQALAQSYLALGEDDRALGLYRTLNVGRAHLALGLHALKIREQEAAIGHLRRATQLDPHCPICAVALANAEQARAAHESAAQALNAQETAFESMKPPLTCLCYLAALTAGSALSSGVLHPSIIALIRKAGLRKQLAEPIVNSLINRLGVNVGSLTSRSMGDPCPRLANNETMNELLSWAELVPFVSETKSASTAALQAGKLAWSIWDYGQGFIAERDNRNKVAIAEKLAAAQWDAFVAESRDPRFIDRDLASLAVPSLDGPRDWLDTLNPVNWFPAANPDLASDPVKNR